MADANNLNGDVTSEERASVKEKATPDYMCCCTEKQESKTHFEAHLLLTAMCFWTLTEKYWGKSAQEAQLCSICKKVFENAVVLKRHCFKEMYCKLRYLQLYFRYNKSESSSISEHLNTENTVTSASTSRRNLMTKPHSSSSSNPSTPGRSSPNSATASVAKAAGETPKKRKYPQCPKSYKEESSLKAHIKKVHINGGQGDRSGVSGNNSTAGEAQSTRRERLNGPSKGFDCGKCRKSGCKRDDFIAHVKKASACLKYYEKPTNTVPHNLRYCFKCKKNHKNITESENHHCLGVVLNTFDCPLCKRRFHTHKSLGNHVKFKHRSERS